jgi:hypothetical protein
VNGESTTVTPAPHVRVKLRASGGRLCEVEAEDPDESAGIDLIRNR